MSSLDVLPEHSLLPPSDGLCFCFSSVWGSRGDERPLTSALQMSVAGSVTARDHGLWPSLLLFLDRLNLSF